MKIIEVSAVREAKDGRSFFVATFRPSLGQRIVKRTFWQQFDKDKEGKNLETKYWERMSPEEAKEAMLTKTEIEGRKVTHQVEPYEVGGKLVDTYSTVLFPDENEETLFANQQHNIVDPETGEVIEKKKKVILAKAEA